MFVKKHFFALILIPLLLLAIGASFYRFLIIHDYEVTYEVDCDPYTNECYVWCEEDDLECVDPFYYNFVSRPADTIMELCGNDITDCEASYSCTEEESVYCSIEYCDADYDECDTLSEEDVELTEDDLQKFFDSNEQGTDEEPENEDVTKDEI